MPYFIAGKRVALLCVPTIWIGKATKVPAGYMDPFTSASTMDRLRSYLCSLITSYLEPMTTNFCLYEGIRNDFINIVCYSGLSELLLRA